MHIQLIALVETLVADLASEFVHPFMDALVVLEALLVSINLAAVRAHVVFVTVWGRTTRNALDLCGPCRLECHVSEGEVDRNVIFLVLAIVIIAIVTKVIITSYFPCKSKTTFHDNDTGTAHDTVLVVCDCEM